MLIHRNNCVHQYGTTDEYFPVEKIIGVFGHKDSRWFLVKYEGCEKPEWSREHLLRIDGCQDSIKVFWAETGLSPTQKFYRSPDNEHRCAVCAKTYKRAQDLKAHKTRQKHHFDNTPRVTTTAIKDATLAKRKEMQQALPKVKWGTRETQNR